MLWLCWVCGIILLRTQRYIKPISVTIAALKCIDAYKDPFNPIYSRKCIIVALSRSPSSIWCATRYSAFGYSSATHLVNESFVLLYT